MYRTEASRRNQWEGGIEKETERKLRGLRELREEGRRSRESGSEFASFARLREAGSQSAERFGPAKREDLKAREPGSLQQRCKFFIDKLSVGVLAIRFEWSGEREQVSKQLQSK